MVTYHKGDVRSEESVKEIVKATKDTYGSVDILVNGAAGNFLCPIEKLSVNGFKTVMDIDTTGTFMFSKEVFTQAFKSQRSGVIINITANLHYNGTALVAHAGAAKAAIDALMRHQAVEWGPYGVRVVGLCPGFIAGTEGIARLSDFGSVGDKDKSKKSIEKGTPKGDVTHELVPLSRVGQPQDIANTALYLASDAASYVSGTILICDGGATLTCPNFPMHYPEFIQQWKAPTRAKM